MKVTLLLLPCLMLMCCSDNDAKNTGALKEIADLDFDETSGLEYVDGVLYAQEDGGNKNKLYIIDTTSFTEKGTKVENVQNIDWEDLTADSDGNLYIGDFGNNDNDRHNLAIYKLAKGDITKSIATIQFYYPEQAEFPPSKSNLIFDCEAFFEFKGSFYLFTKNRSKNFDGTFSVYKVPNTPGNHAARLMGTLTSCATFKKCAIAGADISPDGTKAVLVSGDKLWLITNFGNGDFVHADMQMLELNNFTQKEGVCFKDNDMLYIADEKDGSTGGKLYEVSLKALQAEQ